MEALISTDFFLEMMDEYGSSSSEDEYYDYSFLASWSGLKVFLTRKFDEFLPLIMTPGNPLSLMLEIDLFFTFPMASLHFKMIRQWCCGLSFLFELLGSAYHSTMPFS